MTSITRNGLFLTFEGSEGCGKSTQIRLLAERLRRKGEDPLVLREPGGTPAGEAIRHLLQHAPEGERLVPEAELLLFAASRAQLVRDVILPALASGRIVLCDRFLDSTTVYQGVGRRISPEATAQVNSFAAGSRLPDLTFLLDLDRETALSRMERRGAVCDRIERETEDFFEAVRRGYLEVAQREPARFRILDASRDEQILAEEIAEMVDALKS